MTKSKSMKKAAAGKAVPVKVVGVKMSARKKRVRVKSPGARVGGTFAHAALMPFSQAADGARLPDGNPLGSTTFSIVRKIGIATTSGGEGDIIIHPNLATMAWTTRGSLAGSTSCNLANTATTDNTLHLPVTVATCNMIGSDVGTLGNQYQRYRIVGYGARLRVTSGLTAAGEVTVAVHPIKGMLPTGIIPTVTDGSAIVRNTPSYWSASAPRQTIANYLWSLGLPGTGSDNSATLDTSKLVMMPRHGVMSAAEVAARGLHARGLPFEPAARDFRRTQYDAIGTDAIDWAGNVGSSAANAYGGIGVDMNWARCDGHESIIIGLSGFAASATIGHLELVYHCEGILNPNYSVVVRPTSVVNSMTPTNFDQELAKVGRAARISFCDLVTQAGDKVLGDIEGRVAKYASAGLGSLGGMLSQMLITAA